MGSERAVSAGARFLTLEGGEGAGKSTQVARLRDALTARGVPVLATREPGGSPGAEEIRSLLVAGAVDRWDAVSEALLHFAARRDHLVKTVWPALAAGRWVISDRFADSTRVYQGRALGLGEAAVAALYRLAVGDFAPDLTLILDLPAGDGLARARRRGGDDRYERLAPGFHETLRAAYLEIARRDPGRCLVIDARPPAETVHGAVLAAVLRRFPELGAAATG